MRIKNHWFQSERPKSTREVAGAAAFVAWRIAQRVLANMRAADFQIEPGARYFDFLSEWLIFLVQIADAMALDHLGPEQRIEFTSALANRVGEILADNRNDLLGAADGGDDSPLYKGRFIDLLNLRSADYADFECGDGRLDYGVLRYLADLVRQVVGEHDAVWVHDQVMEIEAPEAAALLRKGLRGLFEAEPRPRRPAQHASGD
jgi:hypothetical protein